MPQNAELTIQQALNQGCSPQMAPLDHPNRDESICDGAEEERRDEGAGHCKD